jgi:hypothetical protein
MMMMMMMIKPYQLIKHHAMKAYWVSGGIVPRILNLGVLYIFEMLIKTINRILSISRPTPAQ